MSILVDGQPEHQGIWPPFTNLISSEPILKCGLVESTESIFLSFPLLPMIIACVLATFRDNLFPSASPSKLPSQH